MTEKKSENTSKMTQKVKLTLFGLGLWAFTLALMYFLWSTTLGSENFAPFF